MVMYMKDMTEDQLDAHTKSFNPKKDNAYNLRTPPPFGVWSGKREVPVIGQRVLVIVNGMGEGVVSAYFFENGYLGVHVKLDKSPEYRVRQGIGHKPAMVFGTEVRFIEQP